MRSPFPVFNAGSSERATGPFRLFRKKETVHYKNLSVPLVVHGWTGTGKTRLIAHNLTGRTPFRRIIIGTDYTTLSRKTPNCLFKIIPANTLFGETTGWTLNPASVTKEITSALTDRTPTLWLVDAPLMMRDTEHHDLIARMIRSARDHTSKNLIVLTTSSLETLPFSNSKTFNERQTSYLLLKASLSNRKNSAVSEIYRGQFESRLPSQRILEKHPNLLIEPGKPAIALSPSCWEDSETTKIYETLFSSDGFLEQAGSTAQDQQTLPADETSTTPSAKILTKTPTPSHRITTKEEASIAAKQRLARLRQTHQDAKLFDILPALKVRDSVDRF